MIGLSDDKPDVGRNADERNGAPRFSSTRKVGRGKEMGRDEGVTVGDGQTEITMIEKRTLENSCDNGTTRTSRGEAAVTFRALPTRFSFVMNGRLMRTGFGMELSRDASGATDAGEDSLARVRRVRDGENRGGWE